ncbi:protein of unknown function [Candidatus Methylomirabilis oxygeniifera]|uniref:Uncharacterized protein n=1 Tax=Methylomirabilis oxygeniifera TaxID=671143 RepID=D5MGU9_METO1|nr:protein of unknown function [Candidatus Methylomirabilis oxyfera]
MRVSRCSRLFSWSSFHYLSTTLKFSQPWITSYDMSCLPTIQGVTYLHHAIPPLGARVMDQFYVSTHSRRRYNGNPSATGNRGPRRSGFSFRSTGSRFSYTGTSRSAESRRTEPPTTRASARFVTSPAVNRRYGYGGEG